MNVNIVLFLSCSSFFGFIQSHELAEKRLHWYLFHEREYMKLIRPVGNDSDKLLVRLGMRLSQLLDVVSKRLYALSLSHACILYRGLYLKKLMQKTK